MTTSHGGVATTGAGGAFTGNSAANALDTAVAAATNTNEASFFIDMPLSPLLHAAVSEAKGPVQHPIAALRRRPIARIFDSSRVSAKFNSTANAAFLCGLGVSS